MTGDQPYFRFNPGAYAAGREFERSDEVCTVCSRPCVWKYTAGVYAKRSPVVCARCIANGDLGKFFIGETFSLNDFLMSGVEAGLVKEIMERTPEVVSYNPFDWPVLDGKPLAFMGYGDDRSLLAVAAVRAAIDTTQAAFGGKFAGPNKNALIFKEIDGERYRAVIDLD